MKKAYIVEILKDKDGFMKLNKKKELGNIEDYTMSTYVDMVYFLDKELNLSKQINEYMYVMGFDLQQHLLGVMEVAHGTENNLNCSMRDIFGALVLMRASRFIVAHNHVDGNSDSSEQDRNFTNKLLYASTIMDIELINHLIVGEKDFAYIMDANTKEVK